MHGPIPLNTEAETCDSEGIVADVKTVGDELARLRTIVSTLHVAVQMWDIEGRLSYGNAAANTLFGGELTVLSGQPCGLRLLLSNDSPCLGMASPVWRVLASGQALTDQIMRLDGDGLPARWLRVHAYPLREGAGGELGGVLTTSAEITSLIERAQHLEWLAHNDALTRLPNRILLADRMQVAMAHSQRTGTPLAVCLLDLDGFKQVNDSYGHKVGDTLLQEVAQRLLTIVRGDDSVARLGGDEFALLLVELKSLGECELVLRRILQALALPFGVAGNPLPISASIGVTIYPDDAVDADKLLRHADRAMYEAKKAGKGRFRYFDPSQDRRIRANRSAVDRIAQGLEAGDFCLHYQPLVNCRSGQVEGMEALVRWRHPVLGFRLPGEFLPLIEQDDMILRLGDWTLVMALRQIEAWQAAGLDLQVGVNIAARQLHQGGFITRLRQLASNHAPETLARLQIEIVETAALEDINAVSELISQGRELGIRFALDDFGTGYSSLVHLQRLRVDALKIDQTFISPMLDEPMDLAIVESVIGMAHAFNRRVVAEGVETIDQVLVLLELGCELMQGYALAKPMPTESVSTWLARYTPDPLWRLAAMPRPSRTDFQLLLTEANYRFWVDRVISRARGVEDVEAPSGDYQSCRFGRWYYGEGMRRYARVAGFRQVEALHRRAHELGERLLTCDPGQDEATFLAVEAELLGARDALMGRLRSLRPWLDEEVRPSPAQRRTPTSKRSKP